jgi:kumamolisin
MGRFLLRARVAASALGVFGMTAGVVAAPAASPDATTPVDLGSFAEGAGDQAITVTVPLKLHNLPAAEELIQRLGTPGDPQFQKFLTPQEVATQFGPARSDVTQVVARLSALGLAVQQATLTTLKATGSAITLERAFQTSLHQFEVAGTAGAPSYRFRAPVARPVMPLEIASVVRGVLGLNTAPAFHSHRIGAPGFGGRPVERATAGPATAGNQPGFLTVKDFAAHYDVDPLYADGITGSGRTLAIVTLASFTPSDAFVYWNSVGLTVDPDRLTIENIDGGPGAPSDDSDSGETTLDVEQSGGVAPGARIIVYQAPNTNQAFLDAFAAAVEENKADSFSTSFGQWEFFGNLSNAAVMDASTGETVSLLQSLHEVLVMAALQGQSAFAASGDSGAFDLIGQIDPGFTTPLSVDAPASDPAIVAGGGTTLPGTQVFSTPSGQVSVELPVERVWGWDYLQPVCDAMGLTPMECGVFPVGSGGGISVFFDIPPHQVDLPGTQRSQPGQAFIDENVTPPQTVFALPGNFPGRNVPDLSFNCDPNTGYSMIYTSSEVGFVILTSQGGTSVVAPQLNGVAALLEQNAGHRIGLLSIPIYALERAGLARPGPDPVINTISTGDNWFYSGRDGYAPAAGVGTIDVANLAKVMN